MTKLSDLQSRIESNLAAFDSSIKQVSNSLPLSKAWVEAESGSSAEKLASQLLVASRLALLEAATGWATGLNRAAVNSLRTYLENATAWIYYKDHPVEYSLVASAKADLLLPKGIQKYMHSVDGGFEKAYEFLKKSCSRPSEYYYTDVSAFVHAHPNFVLDGKSSVEMVISVPPEKAFLTMSAHADEFVSDQYLTYYRHSWGAVPSEVQDHAKKRLGKKLADFMAIP